MRGLSRRVRSEEGKFVGDKRRRKSGETSRESPGERGKKGKGCARRGGGGRKLEGAYRAGAAVADELRWGFCL